MKSLCLIVSTLWLIFSGFLAFFLYFLGGLRFLVDDYTSLTIKLASLAGYVLIILLVVSGPLIFSLIKIFKNRKKTILILYSFCLIITLSIIFPKNLFDLYSFPQYPNAKTFDFGFHCEREKCESLISPSAIVTLTTNDSIEQVFNFYKKEFIQRGYTLEDDPYFKQGKEYFYSGLSCLSKQKALWETVGYGGRVTISSNQKLTTMSFQSEHGFPKTCKIN